MAQTKLGGQTYKEAMIAKYGSYENWIAMLREAGAKGGNSGDKASRGFGSKNIGPDGMTGAERAKKVAMAKRLKALKSRQLSIREEIKILKKHR